MRKARLRRPSRSPEGVEALMSQEAKRADGDSARRRAQPYDGHLRRENVARVRPPPGRLPLGARDRPGDIAGAHARRMHVPVPLRLRPTQRLDHLHARRCASVCVAQPARGHGCVVQGSAGLRDAGPGARRARPSGPSCEHRASGRREPRRPRHPPDRFSSTPVGKTFWHNLKGSSLDTFFKRVHVEPRRQEGSRREAATPGGLPCAARKKASS